MMKRLQQFLSDSAYTLQQMLNRLTQPAQPSLQPVPVRARQALPPQGQRRPG